MNIQYERSVSVPFHIFLCSLPLYLSLLVLHYVLFETDILPVRSVLSAVFLLINNGKCLLRMCVSIFAQRRRYPLSVTDTAWARVAQVALMVLVLVSVVCHWYDAWGCVYIRTIYGSKWSTQRQIKYLRTSYFQREIYSLRAT